MMMATSPLNNYLQWRKARGQPLADDACPYCNFRPQGQSELRLCAYSLNQAELQLLCEAVPLLRPLQRTRLFSCPTTAGGLCALQQQDLHKVKTIVLLGNIAARLVGGERNFARQQGQPYHLAGWQGVTFILTFHPADLLRYPPARELWLEDLQRAARESGMELAKRAKHNA